MSTLSSRAAGTHDYATTAHVQLRKVARDATLHGKVGKHHKEAAQLLFLPA